jgi:hypothetical protein
MSQSLLRLCLSLFVLLTLALPALADFGVAVDPVTCIGCHEDTINTEQFGSSVHGANACTSCHVDIVDVERHASGEIFPEPVNCVRCHKKESGEHFSSVHMLSDITCSACHFDIHVHTPWQGDKNKVVEKCSTCHDVDTYNASVHGQGVAAGNPDSASCHD